MTGIESLKQRLAEHLRQMEAFQWEGAADSDPRPLLTEAHSTISTLQADIARLEKEREWLPIETAPKDGAWILGWAQSDSSPYRISWGRNHNGKLSWCTGFCSFVEGYLTHWAPLPLPAYEPASSIDDAEFGMREHREARAFIMGEDKTA